MTVFHAEIEYVPAYWNRVCMTRIPARWTGRVMIHETETGFESVNADSATRTECIADLIAALKARGLTGKLRIA
jgi:hypothetical protein